MRFSAALTCLVACAAPITAAALNGRSGVKAADDDDHKVPGESPLQLCPGEHDKDLIEIESVDLTPNPPKAGNELVVKATGIVKERIEEGAYVLLTVKYGLIRLLSTKADLCEQIGNVDLECPVEEGKLEFTKTVDLPAEIPPGKYTVLADVYTVDDVQVTCLTATVSFSREESGFFNFEL